MKIYLDYNATTPIVSAARQAMIEALDCLGNPSSPHSHGRVARKVIESSREQVAEYFDIPSRNVTFTSGATEANNLVAKGFDGRVFVSAIEHDSILRINNAATVIPVDNQGVINLSALEQFVAADQGNTLVCVLAVNNETGVIQPIAEVLQICKKYKAHLHVDAAQAVGKIQLDWKTLPSLAISAHKFGGPKGVGAIMINEPLHLSALIEGGGQERGLRAGTENTIGVAGMGAALKAIVDFDRLQLLQAMLEDGILQACPDAIIFGKDAKRVANTTAVAMPNVSSTEQLMHFDLHNISVSAGSACSSGKVKTSHVLTAMGNHEKIAKCALRISTGWHTTETDIAQCIAVWADLFNKRNLQPKSRA